MQTTSKFTKGLLVTATLVMSMTPAVALAEGGSNNKLGSGSVLSDTKRTEFCSNIGTLVNKVMGDADKRIETRKSNEAERAKNRDSRKSERETKITETRTKWDTTRDAEFKKLEELATTDAQKTAVAAFVATMKDAIATRRAAHDKANSDFQTAVQAAVDAQKSGTDTALATMKNAINAAIDKAQTDCSAGATLDSIKAQLKTDIEAARKAFKDSRTSDGKLGDQLKALNETRKSAVEVANAAFKKTAEAARTTLKAAFGETDPTPTP